MKTSVWIGSVGVLVVALGVVYMVTRRPAVRPEPPMATVPAAESPLPPLRPEVPAVPGSLQDLQIKYNEGLSNDAKSSPELAAILAKIAEMEPDVVPPLAEVQQQLQAWLAAADTQEERNSRRQEYAQYFQTIGFIAVGRSLGNFNDDANLPQLAPNTEQTRSKYLTFTQNLGINATKGLTPDKEISPAVLTAAENELLQKIRTAPEGSSFPAGAREPEVATLLAQSVFLNHYGVLAYQRASADTRQYRDQMRALNRSVPLAPLAPPATR